MVIFSVTPAQRKCIKSYFNFYSDAEFNFLSISGEESINISNNASTKSSQHTKSFKGLAISDKISTQLSQNIKNEINNQQMLFQPESMGMSPDPWGDVIDCPMTEYRGIDPESPVSSVNSPMMPLATSTDCETSFSWCVDGEELPLSQKEETMCLANAHLQINQPHTSPSDHSYSITNEFKLKSFDDSFDGYDDGFTTTEYRVLYRDTMVSDASKVISFMDEDTNLEAVNCNEIMIKKEIDTIDYGEIVEYPASVDLFRTPAAKQAIDRSDPETVMTTTNTSVPRINDLSSVADNLILEKPLEKNFIKPEDKVKSSIITKQLDVYQVIKEKAEITLPTFKKKPDNGPITRFRIKKEKDEEENKTARMRHFMNELPRFNLSGASSSQQELNTPDIIEETLNMEEKFDLVDFIVGGQEAEETFDIFQTPLPSPKSPEEFSPESPATDVSSPPSVLSSATSMTKRKRLSVSLYENPSSVQSYQSSTDEPQPKRKRGRPPKTESSLPSPTLLKEMSEQDLRYYEMRNKNNEASRRSRLHRRQKEQSMENEADMLTRHHNYLVQKEKRLKEKVAKLEKKLKEAIQ